MAVEERCLLKDVGSYFGLKIIKKFLWSQFYHLSKKPLNYVYVQGFPIGGVILIFKKNYRFLDKCADIYFNIKKKIYY